jgi:hypothetical protein
MLSSSRWGCSGTLENSFIDQFVNHRRLLLLLLIIGARLSFAEAPAQHKSIRLLTVGNSFSHNATHYLGDLAKAAGDRLILREDNVGGASLELHWSKAQAFEKEPADKFAHYTAGKGLKDALKDEGWDFVTIQQASIKSHDIATYRPFAKLLADYIRKIAPDAKLLLHQTWEYRSDDPRFSQKDPKSGEPKTQDEMYHGLSGAYATIAKELGVRRLPVGDAFHLANSDPQWGFHASAMQFDSKHAKVGELPDQTHSLNVGWNWRKQTDGTMKLGMDGHHANMAGEYLGACVWYEVLFGKSVENNGFVPKGLDAGYAGFLRATAHQAVKNLDEEPVNAR